MLRLKFHENRTINEEFDFLRGEGVPGEVRGPLIVNFDTNYYL